MTKRKTIVWEKWEDPFRPTIDDWPENEDGPYDEYLDNENGEELISLKKLLKNNIPMKAIATPMGIVPITEANMPSNIFNFWVGHTNFNITKDIANIMEKTEGVEAIDIWTRYRVRIAIGKVFNTKMVLTNINTSIHSYLNASSS